MLNIMGCIILEVWLTENTQPALCIHVELTTSVLTSFLNVCPPPLRRPQTSAPGQSDHWLRINASLRGAARFYNLKVQCVQIVLLVHIKAFKCLIKTHRWKHACSCYHRCYLIHMPCFYSNPHSYKSLLRGCFCICTPYTVYTVTVFHHWPPSASTWRH